MRMPAGELLRSCGSPSRTDRVRTVPQRLESVTTRTPKAHGVGCLVAETMRAREASEHLARIVLASSPAMSPPSMGHSRVYFVALFSVVVSAGWYVAMITPRRVVAV